MTEHRDVAAYALGLLDDRAASQFEEHLLGCETCAAELDSMVPVMEALADVDPATLVDAAPIPKQIPSPGRRRGLLRPLNRHRLASHPRALAVAAAVAAVLLLAIGGLIIGGTPPQVSAERTDAGPSPARTAPELGAGDVPAGERYEATDPVTGVHALVRLDSKAWGTRVWYAISQLKGPMTCRLRLVKADGTSEAGSSWKVPPAGYGTEQQPLELQTATSTAADQLVRVQVESVAPDGAVSMLVEVPLRR